MMTATERNGRIGRVRLKNCGADLHIFHNPRIDQGREYAADMVEAAASAASMLDHEVAGYFVICWNFDGQSASSANFHDESPYQIEDLPDYLRRRAEAKVARYNAVVAAAQLIT